VERQMTSLVGAGRGGDGGSACEQE